MRKYNHLVRTTCMTFNHEPYIKDALDGFAIQQTTFPVVYIIVDDASTDNNAHIIEKYLRDNFDLSGKDAFSDEDENCRRIYAQHKENKNCYFAVILLKENHYSVKRPKSPYMQEWCESPKYIAFCEGDDYWISPEKLQKQVNALEHYSNCSMSFHKAKINSGRVHYNYKEKFFLTAKDIILNHCIPTASLMLRVEFYKKIKRVPVSFGDIPLEVQMALQGDVIFMDSEMSVYRDNNMTSITHSAQQKKKGLRDSILVYYYLLKYYPASKYSIFLFYRLFRSIIMFPINSWRVYSQLR